MKDLSKIFLLIDFYGKLLTEKQQLYLNDYYFNDYSLSEIAENNNISRNAVHDSIKKSIQELENCEKKLCFVKNYLKRLELYNRIKDIELKKSLMDTEVVIYGK